MISGRNLERLRVIGLVITTVVGIVGVWYTVTHLNYGDWIIYMGNLMALFSTILIVGFIVFVLEWDEMIEGWKSSR